MKTSIYSAIAMAVAMVFGLPIFWLLASSLRPPGMRFSVEGMGIPGIDFPPTAASWVNQFSSPLVLEGLGRSAVIALTATLLALLLGVPAALALARRNAPHQRRQGEIILALMLMVRILPPIVLAMPLTVIMHAFGLLDTTLALILVNAMMVLPFVVIILRQTFVEIPAELEHAAALDGANTLHIVCRITLPLAAPAIVATGLIAFAFAWNDYIFAIAFFRLEMRTLPLLIASGAGGGDMMVRAFVALMVPVLLALFAQRYIIQGMTMGALVR